MSDRKELLNKWKDIKRKRKNLSSRMKEMLEYIRKDVRVHWTSIKGYHEIGTVNALMNRLLVKRDSTEEYYILSVMTDEDIQKNIDNFKGK